MQFDPAWMAKVIPAALGGLAVLLLAAVILRRWRGRTGTAEAQSMRARIAAAAPQPAPMPAHAPALRQVAGRAQSHLGQRTLLASSFIGRDRSAIPLE